MPVPAHNPLVNFVYAFLYGSLQLLGNFQQASELFSFFQRRCELWGQLPESHTTTKLPRGVDVTRAFLPPCTGIKIKTVEGT